MPYSPPPEILERYAYLAVQCGLRDGEGIRPGETVMIDGHEDAKPLYFEICKEVWRRGGHVIHSFRPEDDPATNFTAAFFEIASDEQLGHFASRYWPGVIDEVDHFVWILGDRNPQAAEGIDPRQLAKRAPVSQQIMRLRDAKERAGQLHWTLMLWGTEALAAEAGLTLEAYWEQIISACFLDDPDPVARWRETAASIHRYRDWLNSLPIRRLHVEAEGTDLWITLGERRRWIGGGGNNIPSFEIFTSPDWRGTEGTITFSEPLYYSGKRLEGVTLTFRAGEVVDADAVQGAEEIRAMVGQPGANRVGEFSMTDARLSRITRFMADTLYDENVGGPFGNCHLAIGASYTEAFDGEQEGVTDETWEQLGFNIGAALHCDIVTTTDRTVTAEMSDGSTRVIYADGRFQIED